MIALSIYLAFLKFTPLDVEGNPIVWYLIGAISLIAIGSYLINDWRDIKSDGANVGKKNFFLAFPSLRNRGLWLSILLTLAGLTLAIQTTDRALVLCLLCAVLLWLYSFSLKGIAFVGNFVAALLHGLVFYAVFLIVPEDIFSGKEVVHSRLHVLSQLLGLLIFGGFAFHTAWIREAIKDMEDVKGDRKAGYKTAAVRYSVRFNRVLILVLESILFLGLMALTIAFVGEALRDRTSVLAYYYIFLMMPLCIRLIYLSWKAESTIEWAKCAQWAKIIMLSGIVSIALF